MPAAHGRFSTITCCPMRSVIFGAMRRDMMSVVFPGGKGMMMRIGFDGYCCAWAAQQTANNSTQSRRFMDILLAMILRALLAGIVAVSSAAQADDYPSKPVRILVGFPPGGATDLVVRILQRRLSFRYNGQVG